MSDSSDTVNDVGYKDVRKASGNNQQVQMSLTGFAERGTRYELTLTEDGFKAEVYNDE